MKPRLNTYLPLSLMLIAGVAQASSVTAPAGDFTGKAVGKTMQYQGIPYAKPPVGKLRWTPPEPIAHLENYQATSFKPICTQPGSMFGGSPDNIRGQEDCLYLNVYVPEGQHESLPVMVWIHGGGFITGSGDQFDPTRLTETQQVISVSFNYRLGPLGYLSHPELGEASGNFGSLDQQLAMKWVKDNIESFGGDPDNITIFGESAGGMSVGVQMLMPASKGLFDKAIMQSGPFLTGSLLNTRSQADAQGETYAKNAGCPEDSEATLACLLDLPAGKATTISGSTQGVMVSEWGPTYETQVIPNSPNDAMASGDYNQVPVINGTNANEGNLFAYYMEKGGQLKDHAAVKAMLEQQYGADLAAEIMQVYPRSQYPSAARLYAQVMTDSMFACPAFDANKLLAEQVPVYAYEFTDQQAPILLPQSPAFANLGAYHAADIVYVFQTDFDLAKPTQLSESQKALSDQIQRYWASFARTGTPNSGDDFNWHQASVDNFTYIDLNPQQLINRQAGEFSRAHHCDLWSRIQ